VSNTPKVLVAFGMEKQAKKIEDPKSVLQSTHLINPQVVTQWRGEASHWKKSGKTFFFFS